MKNLKKITSFILAMAFVVLMLSGCSKTAPVESGKGKFKSGTYTAAGKGMVGDVPVTVVFSNDAIVSVKVGENKETQDIGTKAIQALPDKIVKAQSAEVDVISGATLTSKAIMGAVEDCMAQAMGTEVSKEAGFVPGTYNASARGMAGNVEVTVTFSKGKIESIKAVGEKETLLVGTAACELIPEKVMASQSLGVDVVTGATITSKAIMAALEDCVKQAGGNVKALQNVPVAKKADNPDHEADIIIVGGGLAGITTAISAKENGGDVILLEAKEYLGGNSVLSTGTFQLGGTSIQEGLGIKDDPDTFYKWILKNSGNKKDPVQAGWIAYHSQELVDWFAGMGAKFNSKKVNSTDGSEVERGHALSPNIGTAISTLVDHMNKIGVDIRYSTKVESFILKDGKIVGVKATDYNGDAVEYYGNKIVLASGGFGDNNDMIAKNWGADYDGLVYGGSIGMDGTMLNAAVALGADTVHMDDAHIDATLEVTKGITITTNVLRNCGGILIRQSTGQRFADEQSNHSEIAAAKMHDLGDEYYYEIFDKNALTYSEAVTSKIQSYIDMGLTTEYGSIEAMAKGLGVDANALTQTLEKYNSAVKGEIKDEFGRQRFLKELAAPYYVMKVSNGVACTTGGLKINKNMQVIDTKGNPIPNLYAVGEIAGGYLIHYVGGDSLSRSAISGMLIGKELAPSKAK